MRDLIKNTVFTVGLALSLGAVASERPSHFQGLPAPDLATAVSNFSDYNTRLEAAMSGDLTDAELGEIHILTYTLENALEKINADLAELTQTLEKIHIASETMDRTTLKEAGPEYIKTARTVIK